MSTCSYCWGYGHNKRGCPKMKKDAADDVAAGRTSWRTRYVDQQAHASKNRRCSFCKETGHTRRTCSELQEQKVIYILQSKKLHRAYAAALRRHGIGPGTLIHSGRDVYDYGLEESIEAPLSMITSIEWEKLTPVHFRSNFLYSETTREYQRSSYTTERSKGGSFHCFPETPEMVSAETLNAIRVMGGGYQYEKSDNELFEVVSPMPLTDSSPDWPYDESKVDYKKMAKLYFTDRQGADLGRLDPIIDKWCEIVEKA